MYVGFHSQRKEGSEQCELRFVNEVNDHYIRLSFDADEKLMVIQTNIPDLQSIATKPLANALGK